MRYFSVGWFDIKTKFKKTIRSIFYTKIGQGLICYLVIFYIYLVYYTSRKVFIGDEVMMERFKKNQAVIIASWHNRIMLSPFVAKHILGVNKMNKIASLASKHGDGRFVGKIMEKFGVINISGSSQAGRKASRGIDIKDLKSIFKVIKDGLGIAITPDGPRGPVGQINGEIIKIAKLTSVPIVPMSICYSHFFCLNTWDKFRVPLPFGKICYYYGDLFWVDKSITKEDIIDLNLLLAQKINHSVENAELIAGG